MQPPATTALSDWWKCFHLHDEIQPPQWGEWGQQHIDSKPKEMIKRLHVLEFKWAPARDNSWNHPPCSPSSDQDLQSRFCFFFFYVPTSLTEVFFSPYKYDKIFIPILQKGASAKSSHCSSHAVKSHKAQLAVLQAKLPAGTKYFIIRSGVLLMWRVLCPESRRGVSGENRKKKKASHSLFVFPPVSGSGESRDASRTKPKDKKLVEDDEEVKDKRSSFFPHKQEEKPEEEEDEGETKRGSRESLKRWTKRGKALPLKRKAVGKEAQELDSQQEVPHHSKEVLEEEEEEKKKKRVVQRSPEEKELQMIAKRGPEERRALEEEGSASRKSEVRCPSLHLPARDVTLSSSWGLYSSLGNTFYNTTTYSTETWHLFSSLLVYLWVMWPAEYALPLAPPDDITDFQIVFLGSRKVSKTL